MVDVQHAQNVVTKSDVFLGAPVVGVAVAKTFFGYTLPEWAAIVTIVYTCLLMLRMAWHAIKSWKEKRNGNANQVSDAGG